jgi:hypothetical protein
MRSARGWRPYGKASDKPFTPPEDTPALMPEFLAQLDLVSALVGAAISTPIAILVDTFTKRPTLMMDGSGEEKSAGSGFFMLHLINKPGFAGFQIPEVELFGRKILRDTPIGWHFERMPAGRCFAFIYEIGTKRSFSGYFRDLKNPTNITHMIDLKAEDRGTVFVMAHGGFDSSEYFPFDFDPNNLQVIKIPPADQRFTTERRFRLVVSYGPRGLSKFKQVFTVTPTPSGVTCRHER